MTTNTESSNKGRSKDNCTKRRIAWVSLDDVATNPLFVVRAEQPNAKRRFPLNELNPAALSAAWPTPCPNTLNFRWLRDLFSRQPSKAFEKSQCGCSLEQPQRARTDDFPQLASRFLDN